MGVYCVRHHDETFQVMKALGAKFSCQRHADTWSANTMLGVIRSSAGKMPKELQALQPQHPFYNTVRRWHMSISTIPVEASRYTLLWSSWGPERTKPFLKHLVVENKQRRERDFAHIKHGTIRLCWGMCSQERKRSVS